MMQTETERKFELLDKRNKNMTQTNTNNVQWHYEDLDTTTATFMLFAENISIDCETTGLSYNKDRLKTIQLKPDNSFITHIILVNDRMRMATNLFAVLQSPTVKKTFHFAMFDLSFIIHHYNTNKEIPQNIWCTKILAKMLAVHRGKIGIKEFTLEHLIKTKIDMSFNKSPSVRKGEWGDNPDEFSPEQIKYLIGDVLHLNNLRDILFLEVVNEGIEIDVMELLGIIPTLLKGQIKYSEVDVWNY